MTGGQLLLLLVLGILFGVMCLNIRDSAESLRTDFPSPIIGGRARRRREGRSSARRKPQPQHGTQLADRWIPPNVFNGWLVPGASAQNTAPSPPLQYDWSAGVNPDNEPTQLDGGLRGSASVSRLDAKL